MTVTTTTTTPTTFDFQDLFTEIGTDALRRSRDRIAPHDQVRQAVAAGFTSVRLPSRWTGGGAGLRQFFELLIDLAHADSDVAQILRAHFSFGEQLRFIPDPDVQDRWAAKIAAGHVIGNAVTELGPANAGDFVGLDTTIAPADSGYVINGTKYYSTGTLFADLVWVWGVSDGAAASALVPTDRGGVQVVDDWDGFGQQVTGSGTTVFENVRASADEVFVSPPSADPPPRLAIGAFLQLYLTAVIAGNIEAVLDDAVALLASRQRSFTHGSADRPADDPVLQEVIGEISAKAFAARAVVLAAASLLDETDAVLSAGEFGTDIAVRASRQVAEAKIVVDRLGLDAATLLLDVGGASATRAPLALDRHWRNIRTLASHNPTLLKAAVLGDHVVNKAELPDNTYF